ncbi:MAG: NAD-binding protein, partial [Desulfobacterales bacterium]|nr:NAD-binding protein [Desulfobacterales bacterium]
MSDKVTKRVIVVGLGIFGSNLTRSLYENGIEVIAIDKDKEVVQQIRECCSKAVHADGTKKELMESIGVQEDDVVVISFG